MSEHLDLPDDDPSLVDPVSAIEAIESSANALDGWYAGGQVGERPPGRVRRHYPQKLGMLARLWATPVYKIVYDPDGRPLRKRMRRAW